MYCTGIYRVCVLLVCIAVWQCICTSYNEIGLFEKVHHGITIPNDQNEEPELHRVIYNTRGSLLRPGRVSVRGKYSRWCRHLATVTYPFYNNRNNAIKPFHSTDK